MRLVFLGTPAFAVPTLEAIVGAGHEVAVVITQPDRPRGRGQVPAFPPVKETALRLGLPVYQPERVRRPEAVEYLRGIGADAMVVVGYGQIIPQAVIDLAPLGIINVHASLLPKYRGAAPVAYAILNGEKQTGVTIIKVTPGLDSGDMILQESLDILPDDTTGTLEARLSTLGAKMAVEAAHKYASGGPVEGAKQDPALVTKAPKIKKEFGLIDWTKPAGYIERFVRAMQPWPTAYTFLHRPGKDPMRVIITKIGGTCATGLGLIGFPPPGTPGGGWWTPVNGLTTGTPVYRLTVFCGDRNEVIIQEVQPAGKKKMTAEEFLRGYPIVDGMRFGPEVLS
jgi:methionyl-tRNA formyltransferase